MVLDYLRSRDPNAYRPPLLRSSLRYPAYRLLDAAGGDYEAARRALDDAAAETARWLRASAS
jgi:hypothetical protein